MRAKVSVPLAVSTALCLSGCLVLPGGDKSPVPVTISGTLLDQGEPVRGAIVRSAFGTRPVACEKAKGGQTVTGSDGAFSLAPEFSRSAWRVVPLAPSSPTFFVSLCLGAGEAEREIFTGQYYGSPPSRIEIRCELTSTGQACLANEGDLARLNAQ